MNGKQIFAPSFHRIKAEKKGLIMLFGHTIVGGVDEKTLLQRLKNSQEKLSFFYHLGNKKFQAKPYFVKTRL